MRASPFFLAIAVLVASGCGAGDAEARRARAAAERRSLETTFDQLEERLLASQARVRFWREMRERHESVTAIACVSQQEHAEEMAAHGVQPQRPLYRARVAAASTTDPAPARAAATP